MLTVLPLSPSTLSGRMDSSPPPAGRVLAPVEPLRRPSPLFVSMPVIDFESLCTELCFRGSGDADVSPLTAFCRSVKSDVILVNRKKMFRDICWSFRAKRADQDGVDHDPERLADHFVMEGAVATTAYYHGLCGKPDVDSAYLQELGDEAKRLLWRGEDAEHRRRWLLDASAGGGVVSLSAQNSASWALGFALISGYCNHTEFPVRRLHEVSTIEVIRDWMAGDFELAPDGPVRQKRPATVPHWTVSAQKANA
ncbi:MAG: hypothetical protein PHD48_10810 [Alphaproteobacteria bacterium]|nr:hypothetical protein [Alphaproteobacteria bacterium]